MEVGSLTLETQMAMPDFMSLRRVPQIGKKPKPRTQTKKPLQVRKEFPETWLWTEEIVK